MLAVYAVNGRPIDKVQIILVEQEWDSDFPKNVYIMLHSILAVRTSLFAIFQYEYVTSV